MKFGPRKKHWRVEVEWEDSTLRHGGWEKVADVLRERGMVRVVSCGFLLATDEKGIVLAGGVHGNEAHGVAYIPRGAVRRVRRLR